MLPPGLTPRPREQRRGDRLRRRQRRRLVGHLVYFAASDAEWHGLVHALGHPEWWEDDRFTSPAGRFANFPAIGSLVNAAFLALPTDEALAALHAHQVPAAPVNSLEAVFDDEQVVHNDVVHTWEHPTAGPIRQARPPVRWSHTEHEAVWDAETLGQSTDDVLRANGYDDAALGRLRDAGVIR